MRLKSFHGASLTEAMAQVRQALGDNAIIVATRDDDLGGVRVTAAIEDQPTAPIKEVFEPIDEETGDECAGSEVIEIIATALVRHQVPTALAERFLATATQFATDDPVMALGAAFDTHLEFKPLIQDKSSAPIIFVGTPGAGKTLCTAKFATQATLSKRKVGVISTDVERAGGLEQLAVFTRLLKLNLIEIEDHHALKDAVAMQDPSSLVLIDTAGCNPFLALENKNTQEILSSIKGDGVLVLPADIDALAAIDLANAFKKMGVTSLLFTRLDMTRRLGALLRIAFETKLPLTTFSASPKVTEAPTPFTPITLARLVLPQTDTAEIKATGTH